MTAFSELDRLLAEATRSTAPAIVCRVEQHGELLYEAAFGAPSPADPQQPLAADILFDFASLTKLSTTTACLRLCSLGTVKLDTAVADVVPEFGGIRAIGPTEDPITKLPQPTSPYWRKVSPSVDAVAVTIRQLLTHTSGLPAWRNVYRMCGDTPAPGRTLPRAEVDDRQSRALAAVCSYDFAYAPGLSYTYSDIGLILLGAVVARLHGSDALDSALQELVIAPLGLDARFNPPLEALAGIAPTEYCPWRSRRLHGEVHDENAAGMGGIAGHAGLFGTAADLCRLGRVYLDGDEQLLRENIVRESVSCQVAAGLSGEPLADAGHPCAQPDPEIRRGLGWVLPTKHGASCGSAWSASGFGHTGFTGTSLWCDPERDLAVALLTNRVYWGRDPEPIQLLRERVHSAIVREFEGR